MVRKKSNRSQRPSPFRGDSTEPARPRMKAFDGGDPTAKVNDFLSDLLDQNPGLETLKDALVYVVDCEEQLSVTLEVQQAAYHKTIQRQLRLLKEILVKIQGPEVRQMVTVDEPIEATVFLHSEVGNYSQFVDKLAAPGHPEQQRDRNDMLSPEVNYPSEYPDATVQDNPVENNEDLSAEAWILETWLRSPFDGQCDVQAEQLFGDGKLQQGIIYIDRILSSSMPLESTINTMLLQSCALRSCGCAHKGLPYTERAVRIADKENMPALLRKAQFYRGLCLFDLGFYRDATWCFLFAGGHVKFGHLLRQYTKLAEEKQKALPNEDGRRRRSKGFRIIPLES